MKAVFYKNEYSGSGPNLTIRNELKAAINIKNGNINLIEGDIKVVNAFLTVPVLNPENGKQITPDAGDAFLEALPENFNCTQWTITVEKI